MIAKVIVDVKHENVDNVFDYIIPPELADIVQVGSRVQVEFGLRKVLGYIIEITDQAEFSGNLKPILEALDFGQNLNLEQVKMAEFLNQTTNAFYSSCLDIMLPSFLKAKYRKYLIVNNFRALDADLARVIGPRKKVTITPEIIDIWPKVTHAIKLGHLEVDYGFSTYGKRRYSKFYLLAENYFTLDQTGLSDLRRDVLSYLEKNEKSLLEDLTSNVGCSEYLVNDLVKKGYLQTTFEHVIESNERIQLEKKNHYYNFPQQEIIQKYQTLSQKPFLLFTNDEDFKTKFLVDVIIETINNNKQVLILTPTILNANEMSLLIKRKLKQVRTITLTSNLKNNEYYDQYLNILANNIDVLITTKIGIFSPLENVGLIIGLDEGHPNYINEQNPRFNCRDILQFRAKYHHAKLILTASPPTIKTYYDVYLSKYYLLKYFKDHKVNSVVINMKDEILNFGTNILSNTLMQAIHHTVNNNKQALLILNRLAHSSLIRCENCQEVEKCPHCDISLSYYQRNNVYRCTYCNYSISATGICSSCHSRSLSLHGFGLEQLSSVVQTQFPNAKVLMLDASTINTNFEEILMAIEEGHVDIILGTAIVMDAFRNSKIELIGLIDPDRELNIDNYKASEIVFRDLYKCINRVNTKVYIQTFHKDHPVFKYAIMNDFESFYEQELTQRQLLNYEPFMEINRLLISGEFKSMYYYANYLKKVFNRVIKSPKNILGPVYLPKHTGIQLIIKHQDYEAIIRLVKNVSEKFKKYNLNIIFEQYPISFN